ncbi:acyl-CoA N-acyltransferase [Hypoxylon fuscum]|nr:acyl-CoA N-acyltransferase [Hypoxylon fuscum]
MSEQQKVKVKTTLPTTPLPSNAERKEILTERLILRPFAEDDLEEIYAMRTQPECMIYTLVGRIDADRDETRAAMARYLPPNDTQTYNTAIRLASTGELIGTGGAIRIYNNASYFGWPECGYMFRKEYWGQGFATEFLSAFVKNWWTLPRSEVEIEVDAQSVDGPGEAPEMLTLMTDGHNVGSRKVAQKAGFREFKEWSVPDSREGFSGNMVTLFGYAAQKE